MLTKLMLEHLAAYHANALEKMQKATDLGDSEQYAYWYGGAVFLELSVEVAGGKKNKEQMVFDRTSAGFGGEVSPVLEI